MLDALMVRHERKTEDREFLFAQLTAALINHSGRTQQPVKAEDYMPSHWAKRAAAARRGPTRAEREAIAEKMRGIMHSLMKEEK